MNIADVSLRYRIVVVIVSFAVLAAGLQAYRRLGRLEDPSFPIKQAVVVTSYAGASPQEVADEVTDPLEAAIQQLEQVDYLSSRSTSGQSVIKIHIKEHFGADELPQIWDELRRQVQAAAAHLPPGAGAPRVDDDFGDVYGVLFYLYGDGFSLAELHGHAKFIRKELLRVEDVGGVALLGAPQEVIFVDVSPEQFVSSGLDVGAVAAALEGQGLVTPAGDVRCGPLRLGITPTGQLDSVEAIRSLYVRSTGGASTQLKDVARISRGYREPPGAILRFNGFRAIALGVSTLQGGNVVTMGEAVAQRLEHLQERTPVGIEMGVVSMQSEAVRRAVRGFTVGLVESVAIVVGVLLLAMGLRAGVLIGGALVLTITATFVVMQQVEIELQRISLGALIIALGMLVDNAIVVVEGMIAGAKQGRSRADAARQIVGQTTWPLLGATVIAILAFAPIGLSPDSTGDYCGSLFTVIAVSLLLSWLFALTSTPVLGTMMLPGVRTGDAVDPYAGPVFRGFRRFLEGMLAWRWVSLSMVVVLLAIGAIGFGKARQGFFPASARPQFMVEYWTPQGTDIEEVDRQVEALAGWVRTLEGVESVATSVGSGTLRFELTYTPESPNPSYAQLLVSVTDAGHIDDLMTAIDDRLRANHPGALGWPWRMVLGPGGEAKIQVRLSGPDATALRRLGAEVEAIMAADSYVTNIRSDWRERALLIAPELDDAQMARLDVTRRQVNRALDRSYDGRQVGLYREGDLLIPVLIRSPATSGGVDRLLDVLVESHSGQRIPLDQVARHVSVAWHDPIIHRRDRTPTLTVMCDPAAGGAPALFGRLRPKVEALALPVGYSLAWGGEYEKSARANAGLTALMPLCFGAMVLILIALFNNVRQPLIIILTVPLAIVGVTIGLLGTGAEFGFMPILGVLSLTGMLIKNSIVLIDEANAQVGDGRDRYVAIVNSAVSRARPVAMAALTTVLGMVPLLTDVFFKDMAIVIMSGLAFATALTLCVVPLLYVILYRAHPMSAPVRDTP